LASLLRRFASDYAFTVTHTSLRVLHIVPALFDENDGIIGGAERYVYELARHMADETTTGLVAFGKRERRESVGNLEIHVLARSRDVRGQACNPFSLRVFNEVFKADVVHCYQRVLVNSVAAALCRATGRRVFMTDLGGGGWNLSNFLPVDQWYHGHLHISQYSKTVSHHDRAPFAHVISGGVDTEKFSPLPTARRERKVVYVGRLLPHKGVDHLIRAMPANLELQVIGRAYDSDYFLYLQRLAVGRFVRFRQDCDDIALIEAYRTAACVVLPSVYLMPNGERTLVPELLGQTLLEGMACGAPVVCTNVASLPEIVEDGLSGFIVPPNGVEELRKRIVWLCEHPEEGARIGTAARKRIVDHFTWPRVVARCLDIYRGISL